MFNGIYSGLHYKKQYYQESAFMRVTTESAAEGALVQVMSGNSECAMGLLQFSLNT